MSRITEPLPTWVSQWVNMINDHCTDSDVVWLTSKMETLSSQEKPTPKLGPPQPKRAKFESPEEEAARIEYEKQFGFTLEPNWSEDEGWNL